MSEMATDATTPTVEVPPTKANLSGFVTGTFQTAEAAVRRTRQWTIRSIIALLALIIFFVIVQLRTGAWAAAVALCLALLAAGYVLGLLFAVPKSTATEPVRATPTPRHLLVVNTSFEQISDWLTKIIVGVGLVQFNQILQFTGRATKLIGTAFANPSLPLESAEVLAGAIIVAFPALGVLLGFYSVRLYIAYAMYVTDESSTGRTVPSDELTPFDPNASDKNQSTTR